MLGKSLKNTGVQVVGKAITVLISLVTTAILVRKLGTVNYGLFTLVTAVLILLDSLADFGTRVIGVREAAKDVSNHPGIFKNLVVLRLVMASGAMMIGLVWLLVYPGISDIRNEILLALLMSGFTSLAGSLEIIFQSKMRLDLKTLMDVAFPGLFLIFLLVWGGNLTLLWVFGAYLAARGVSLIWGAWLVNKIWKLERLKNVLVDKKTWGWLLKESWPMGLYLIIFTSYDRALDSMIINHYWGASRVAWYGLGYKIYGNLIMPAYFFISNVFPMLSVKNRDKKKIFDRSLLISLVMALTVMVVMYVLAPLAIKILAGDSFYASVEVLRVLLLALGFSYIGHIVGFTLISEGGQKEMLKVGLGALLINLVLNLLLIPYFGIIAAAWVTVLTEAIAAGMMWFYLRKKSL